MFTDWFHSKREPRGYKKKIGDFGEKLARRFLKNKGYRILATHFQTRIGEIDIIARDKDEIVFVEVKTRTSETFGLPEEAIDWRKQQKLIKTAQEYLFKNHLEDNPWRIDSVAIEINSQTQKVKIRHIKAAVEDMR